MLWSGSSRDEEMERRLWPNLINNAHPGVVRQWLTKDERSLIFSYVESVSHDMYSLYVSLINIDVSRTILQCRKVTYQHVHNVLRLTETSQ